MKLTLNTRRVIFLSLGFSFLGLMIFLFGMVVGAKIPPPSTDKKPQLAERKASDVKPKKVSLKEGSDAKISVASLDIPQLDKSTPGKAVDPAASGDPKAKARKPGASIETDFPLEEKDRAGKRPDGKKTSLASSPEKGSRMNSAGGQIRSVSANDSDLFAGFHKTSIRSGYTVQVGAFLDRINADILADDLKKRGYSPYVLSMWDSMKRQWHTVRLGDYNSEKEANKIAVDFSQKEQMEAAVRGVGIL